MATTSGPAVFSPISFTTPKVSAPTTAAHGSVSTQATAMFPATPQRTAERRLAAPAPMMPPEITWVVERGKPTCEAERMTAAPAPWAANPCAGSILMMRLPIVRMMRQPPTYVPAAIALAALTTTQVGMESVGCRFPFATRARKTMPIVFWASLVPCESENSAPEIHWPWRKARETKPGGWRPVMRYVMTMPRPATSMASGGAISAGTMTFSTRPDPLTALDPSATNAEPTTPPISACEDDEGSPNRHVARFQAMAPIRPANTIGGVMTSESTMPVAIVAATWSDMNAPTKFSVADIATAVRGPMARVETDVAIALAVSWNPLVKSNASAVATTIHRTTSECTDLATRS